MADGPELIWPIEEIPDADSVFMRAHRQNFRDGELKHGVFKQHGSGMSVNWDKCASAEDTKQQSPKKPDDNAVISMPVVRIRQINDLKVEHTPNPANRAHSHVRGLPKNHEELTQMRVLLLRITNIVIPLANQ